MHLILPRNIAVNLQGVRQISETFMRSAAILSGCHKIIFFRVIINKSGLDMIMPILMGVIQMLLIQVLILIC
jgi:hypothetical protein